MAGRKPKNEKWRTADGLKQIEAWARDGLTGDQIAHNLGIHRSTFCRWLDMYEDIAGAVSRGREVVDIEVENALLRAAMGYRSVEVVEDLVDGEMTVVRRITKDVPPNPTAMVFWLKNRKPEVWRERKDVSMTADIKAINPYANLSEEELKKLVAVDDG